MGEMAVTLPKLNIAPEKMMVGKLLSFWEGNFSEAMLNFRWVVSGKGSDGSTRFQKTTTGLHPLTGPHLAIID